MPPPSNRRAFPDRAHEELAQWVEETVAENRSNSNNRADIADSLLLVDVLFTLLDALTEQVADLTARVAVLEPAVFTTEEPPVAH